jgi:hypothetical protein
MAEQFNADSAVRYYRHGEEFWRDLIARQMQSGSEVRKFCIANGVASSTFHKWRKLLADRNVHGTLKPVSTPDAMFIPITAGSDAVNAAAPKPAPYSSPRSSSRDCVIVNSGGVRIELTGAHADQIVRHLLGRMNGLTC